MVTMLPWPYAYVCQCSGAPHGRGIARCEWNEDRGWRPRPVPDVEHEVTGFTDLARGVRVFLLSDGTRREEPIEP